jgi:hypothetical protein
MGEFPISTNFGSRNLKYTDLGSKYQNSPILENIEMPGREEVSGYEVDLNQVECVLPRDGNNSGTQIRWVNHSATQTLTVLAFANSFFERGGDATTLSWWAARSFKEFHFCWETNIDFSYVEKIKLDIVICQTVERFLPRVAEMRPNAGRRLGTWNANRLSAIAVIRAQHPEDAIVVDHDRQLACASFGICDIYVSNNLHLKPNGYAIIGPIIAPTIWK